MILSFFLTTVRRCRGADCWPRDWCDVGRALFADSGDHRVNCWTTRRAAGARWESIRACGIARTLLT